MFRRIKKLWAILKYFFKDEDNLLLHLMEMKAYEALNDCATMEVSTTEEIEDLIFHIKAYYDIPTYLAYTKYPKFMGVDIKEAVKMYKRKDIGLEEIWEYTNFMADVEKQRAVEREIIFEHAKTLTFGFKL